MNKLDKNKCKVLRCNYSDISNIFKNYHYKTEQIGGGISVCFAMFINDKLIGGAVLGVPRHEKKYKNCIDVRRMACIDDTPTNTESYFLGQIIQYITCNTKYDNVLSYSDLSVNHVGTIYKAANFKKIGTTSPTKWVEWLGKKYHPRSITIDRDYSYKMREALKTGEAKIITGKPKIVWIYKINSKKRGKVKDINIYTGDTAQLTIFDAGA